MSFGHVFPKESPSAEQLFEEHKTDAPKHYCRKIVVEKNLKHLPHIRFQAVFYIEGNKVKYSYNNMIRRNGYPAPEGGYTVQQRYGLWICKDYIPIQKKNEWITVKGSEFIKFHSFVNCQALKLTANRGSIENTPGEILKNLEEEVVEIVNRITDSDEWAELSMLESQSEAYNTKEKEDREYNRRLEKIKKTKIADYCTEDGKVIRLIEPRQENGVFSLFMQISSVKPDLFPFTIIDYDTHCGIDVIAKAKNDRAPLKTTKKYYVEFKNYLTKDFNHSFENLHSIVCWDIDDKQINSDVEVSDISYERRTLKIIHPQNESDYTRFYLDSKRSERKIEVFVLKYYLEEKLGIQFNPRTEDSLE